MYRYIIPWYFEAAADTVFLSDGGNSGDAAWITTGNLRTNLQNTAQLGVIPLPNGSVYDAHQTYAAPVLFGELSAQIVFNGRSAAFQGDRQAGLDAINYQYELLCSFVGRRGTLVGKTEGAGAAPPGNVQVLPISCTARLKSVITQTVPPSHLPTLALSAQYSRLIIIADIVFTILSEWDDVE